MSWQPIETAPKDGTTVFLVHDGRPYVGSYYSREEFEFGTLKRKSEGWNLLGHMKLWGSPWEPNPTHWMSIPSLKEGA